MALGKEELSSLLEVLRKQVRVLEEVVEVYQEALALVPLPTLEEVAEMRQGERALTLEAYLAGVLQRGSVDAANLAYDMRDSIQKSVLRKVEKLRLGEAELNEIAAAVKGLRA
jgi:hypothetical protein